MAKLRVDIYNPYPNTSALFATGPSGTDMSSLGSSTDLESLTGSLIPGAIMGDNMGTGFLKPLADSLTGTDGNDRILGGFLNDTLDGGGGDDFLSGDQGEDLLIGGFGNDTIYGSLERDIITGNEGDDLLMGDDGNDLMFGGVGNDALNGGTGRDEFYGDAGDDLLIGGEGDDILNGGTGYDRAEFLLASESVKIDLNKKTFQYTGQGWDQLISIEFVMSGTGNDRLIGNKYGNTLMGSAGNDKLYGKLGIDALWGGKGRDKFVFDTKLHKKRNLDWLYDFNRKEKDKIVLDNDIFKGLKAGKLKKSAFHIGSKAKDADDRILYNKAVKALAYDPDGNGPKAATMFAKFPGKETLKYTDFLIIG